MKLSRLRVAALVAVGLCLGGYALAQVPGAQVITALTGTQYFSVASNTVSAVISGANLANGVRTMARTGTALAASGNASLDPTTGTLFTITPTASENITAASAPAGVYVSIVVTTSGTSSFTLTFTTKFKTTGTLATGTVDAKVFTITFVGDGTNFNEVARTTAM